MINSARFDPNTLAAVKPGVDGALAEISMQLERYLKAPAASLDALEIVCTEIHRLVGVLKMVGLGGLVVYCTELERALNELKTNPEQVSDLYRDVLRRALFAVTHYLDALADGADNAALRLFPQYQELQQLRGLEMSFELDLFFPNLDVQLPQQILKAPQQQGATSRLKVLRVQYQQGLLKWLRQEDVPGALQMMQQAVGAAMFCEPQDSSRGFWWVAYVVLECMKFDAFPPETNVRKLLGRIDQQMRMASEGQAGDAAETQLVMNEMLYLIARSEVESDQVKAIKQVYSLDKYLPEESTMEFSQLDQQLSIMRDQLRVAEESWDLCVQGDQAACDKFSKYAELIKAQSEKLGRETLQYLTGQIQTLSQYATTPEHAEPIALDMAMALLLLNTGIENYNRLGSGFHEQARILSERMHAAVKRRPEEQEEGLAEFAGLHYQMEEQGDAMASLATEMLVNLQHVEEGLNVFFNDSSRRSELGELLRLLNQIQGGLSILSLTQAGQLLTAIQKNVRRFSQSNVAPRPAERYALADAMSALENYMQHLTHGQSGDVSRLLLAMADMAKAEQVPPPAPPRAAAKPAPTVVPAAPIEIERPSIPAAVAPAPKAPAPAAPVQITRPSAPSPVTPVAGVPVAEAPVAKPPMPEVLEFEQPRVQPVEAPVAEAPVAEAGKAQLAVPEVLEFVQPEVRPPEAVAPEVSFAEAPVAGEEAVAEFAALESPFVVEQPEAAPVTEVSLGEALVEEAPIVEAPAAVAQPQVPAPEPAPAVRAEAPEAKRLSEEEQELLDIFLEEAQDVLATMRDNLEECKRDPGNHDALVAVRRGFHTLKGSGRMVGLTDLGEVAWSVERAMNKWLADKKPPTPWLLEFITVAERSFSGWVDALQKQGAATIEASELVESAQKIEAGLELGAREAARAKPAFEEPAQPAPTIEIAPAPEEALLPEISFELPVAAEEKVAEEAPAVMELAPVPEEIPLAEISFELPVAPEERPEETPAVTEAAWAPEEALLPEISFEFPAAAEEKEVEEAPAVMELAPVPEEIPLPELSFELPAAPEEKPEELPPVMEVPPAPEEISIPEISFELPTAEKKVAEAPVAPAAEEVVVIGEITLPQDLFEIASLEAMQNVGELHRQYNDLSAGISPTVRYDFMRAAHTLGGVSRTMGFEAIVALAHALEEWLRDRVDQPAVPSAEQMQMLEQSITALDEMVQSICDLRMPQPRHELIGRLIADKGKIAAAVSEIPVTPSAAEKAAVSREVEQPAILQPAAFTIAKPAEKAAEEEKPQVYDDVDEQLLPVFLEEAEDLAPKISEGLRTWRENPLDEQLEHSLKRLLHTMKGSSRMVGAMRIGEIAHEMETQVISAAKLRDQPGYWEKLESDFDRINALLEELRGGKPAPVEVKPQEIKMGRRATDQAIGVERRADRRGGEPLGNVLRVRADIVDRLVNDASEISVVRARMEAEMRAFKQGLHDLTASVMHLRQQLREVEIQAESQMQARTSQARDSHEGFDPLEFDRFTRLQELTRFMNESVHDVQTVQSALLKNLDETAAVMQHQARLNRELQQGLMNVRMVSFNSISDRLYRIVRQTCKELNKRANLELQGTGVELDRSVLERMIAPFEHLLRNSIVHGLEDAQQRARSGKNPIGEIRLLVRQEGNEVVFEFSDDGVGLNYTKLREKGIAKGMLRPDEPASDDQLAQLIFMQGISTAPEVTEIAGRGVGMDVVRNEIASLGGRIDVASKRGQGTQFTIYLPLTLAVTHVVIVRSGESRYAIPSTMVEQIRQVKSAEMDVFHREQKIEWQGRAYPLHYLPHLLGVTEAVEVNQPRNPVLMLRAGDQRIALHVDELLGNLEAMVKNVGPQLARLSGIAGATVLGNGEVLLILNPPQLAQRVVTATMAAKEEAGAPPMVKLPIIMVVDDSLTVRKITSRMLVRAGYEVVTATDGVDALEKLEEMGDEIPDVMLLDIEMPRMDGFALAKHLRRDPKTKSLPIIMITSRTADKHRDYAMQLGVNTYLGKPYQEDELLQNIADFVAAHKLDL